MEWNNLLFAFVLTLMAGLATAIGGALAFFTRRTNTTFLSFSLGFSAGVMIYISFIEIIPQARSIIGTEMDFRLASWITLGFFVGGFFLTALIDKILPMKENPHDVKFIEQMDNDYPGNDFPLLRVGVFTAIAITIHNFPEGMATFMASVSDTTIGITIAVAIAIHNIPEGIAVSVPVFYSTGSRKKAFLWSVLSGLSEPVGAAGGYFILSFFKSSEVLGYVLAIVAGIMVYISFDELLPAASKYGKHHTSIYGLISGMIVIGISLIIL